MKDLAGLQALLAASEAAYESQRKSLARLQQEEISLRAELERLQALDRLPADPGGMRAIGADVLWRGWLGRARAGLNLRLARVLARKLHEQERLRRAFGRVCALRELVATEAERRRKSARARSLDAAIRIALGQ